MKSASSERGVAILGSSCAQASSSLSRRRSAFRPGASMLGWSRVWNYIILASLSPTSDATLYRCCLLLGFNSLFSSVRFMVHRYDELLLESSLITMLLDFIFWLTLIFIINGSNVDVDYSNWCCRRSWLSSMMMMMLVLIIINCCVFILTSLFFVCFLGNSVSYV